jgi:sulfatase maturation enzyme AslB (radical SAM superfamily)
MLVEQPVPSDQRLQLARKLWQPALAQRIRDVAEGRPTRAPVVVELDPTSNCDLACPECISGSLLQRGGFSEERLRALAREMVEAGVAAVILIGGGEPLLHPAIEDVLTILGESGVRVGLTTNGTQLQRHMDPIARYVSWTRVSVDAATAETYARVRPRRGGPPAFDSVIEGMRELRRRATGALGFSFLVVRRQGSGAGSVFSNHTEIAEAARLAKDIGCHYFEVKPEYDMGHRLLARDPGYRDELASQLRTAKGLQSDSFSILSPAHLEDVLSGAEPVQPKNYARCPVADLRTLVTHEGAFICPYHRGQPEAAYGSPTTEHFSDMWTGGERRRAMDRIDPRKACTFHCIRHDSNLELIELGRHDVDPHRWQELPEYDPFV